MGVYGRIHSFESFGTVDGPGIRYVVFLQGCPIQCKFCHNRDTWDKSGGKEYDVDTVVNKILRCKTYIDASNGGVTASGGEPLLQATFLLELFKKLKSLGINTALDTAGSLPITDEIKELLQYTDLVILDIKHIDNEKCIKLTGHSNENEINFAKYLAENNIPMWVRQVLVPGYTDGEDDLRRLKQFVVSLNNVKKMEVLPYHDLGQFKWEKLNLQYPLKDVRIPTQEEIQRAQNILGIASENHFA